VLCSEWGVWGQRGKPMGELLERSAETVVFLVVAGFLDVVASDYRCVAVVVVPRVRREVDFSKELLLMVLEFSDHDVSKSRCDVVVRFCGEVEIIFGMKSARKNVFAAPGNCNSRMNGRHSFPGPHQ